MVSFCNVQYNVVQPGCSAISYNNNDNDNDGDNHNHNHNHNHNDNDTIVIVIAIVIIIILSGMIVLIMKLTGRIIFKTTFRCPHDTINWSKYNIQQTTRILMLLFKFKFLVPRG